MAERKQTISSSLAGDHLAALARISEQLRTAMNLSEVLQTVFFEAMANTSSDGGQISLYRDSAGSFLPRHEIGDALSKNRAMELEQEVLETHKSVIRDNIRGRSPLRAVLVTPILYEGVIAGLISLYSRNENHFDINTVEFVNALSNLASVAIVNAQLYQDTLDRERFYGALGRITLAMSGTVDLMSVLSLVCLESLELFEVDGAYIWQREGDKLVGAAAAGHAHVEFMRMNVPVSDTRVLASAVCKTERGLFSNNFGNDKRYIRPFRWQAAIKSVLAIPLRKDADVIGVLELVDLKTRNRFTLPDIDLATFFGSQAATAIQNARLVTDMRKLNEQLDLRVAQRTQALGEEKDRVQYLLRVTSELSASLDQDRVLTRALELVNEVVRATHGSISLFDSVSGELVYPSAFDTHQLPPIPRAAIGSRPEKELAGVVAKSRSALIVDDSAEDLRWASVAELQHLRSILAVPLIANDDVIGVLTLFHEKPGAFSQEQLELVEAAAIQVANAISNAQLYLLIRDQAERLGQMLREEHIESAKNQAILESIADGVLVANDIGQVVLANISAGHILEIEHNKLRGKNIKELLGIYAATGENWLGAIKDWSQDTGHGQHPQYLAEQLEIEEKIVSIRLSPVFAGGQFFGTVSIFRDVTQQVAVDRMKSEFVSTVSHELRTPMTSIKGYAELILMGAAGDMNDAQTNYLEVISQNADRMSDLVNDLLDISRMESGRTTLELAAVSLSEVIQQVIDTHLNGLIRHEDKAITVRTEINGSLPKIRGDRDRVTQIVTNLLDNAFHYTPEGGGITVSARRSDEQVIVNITDTGIGLSEDELSKIFSRFYRSDRAEVQKVSGTGLGLAIVESLVEMHGGQIWVESVPDQGSTFSFSLPVATRTRVKAIGNEMQEPSVVTDD